MVADLTALSRKVVVIPKRNTRKTKTMRKSMIAFLIGLCAALSLCGQTQAFRWVKNWSFTGFGNRQTEPFQIWGSEWRLAYTPHGKTPFGVTIHEITTGRADTLVNQQQNGRNATGGTARGKGAMRLAYLTVNAWDASWKLQLEQYMDKPDEWQYINWTPYEKKLKPFGSWGGAVGDRELSIEVSDGIGRMTIKQNRPGRLCADIIDESGLTILHRVSLEATSMDTWFYKPGVYTVRVSAIDTEWSLFVETVEK